MGIEAFERALTRSTTLARAECGEWVIHTDWTGNAGYPYSTYVWKGDDWVETGWAATEPAALAQHYRTALRVAFHLRWGIGCYAVERHSRSTAAA